MNCDEKSIRDAVAASKTFADPNVRRYYETFEPLLAEIERLRNDARNLRDVLLRNGFVPCDSPACNCGSWHHRYGLPERMQEIKDELAEAGHELSNANGNLTLNALKALVAERDDLRRQLAECSQMLARQAATIRELTRP